MGFEEVLRQRPKVSRNDEGREAGGRVVDIGELF
jgi:hypothetical protein